MPEIVYSKFWSEAFEAMEDFVFLIDKDFNILKANKKFLKFIKKPKKDVIGSKCYKIIHGLNKPYKYCPHKKTLTTKKPQTVQFFEPYLKRWFFLTTAPIFDEKRRVLGSLHWAKDITKEKILEQELKIQLERFNRFCNVMGGIVVALDLNKKVTFINKRGAQLLGYKQKDIIGKNWFKNFLPKRVRKQTEKAFESLISGEPRTFGSYENPVLVKDKKEKAILWSNTVLKDEKGEIIGTLSSGQDITQLKKAEESVLKAEQRYREIFELAPQAIVVLDKKGRVIDVNKRLYAWLGYKPEEVIGKSLLRLPYLPAKSKVKAFQMFSQRLLGKEILPYELEFTTKRRERKVGKIDAVLVRDNKGSILYDLVMISNITEERKIQEGIRRVRQEEAVITSLLRLSLEEVTLEEILDKALGFLLSLSWFSFENRAGLFLVEEEGYLTLKAQQNLPKEVKERCKKVSFGECLCGRTALTKQIQFTTSLEESYSLRYRKGISQGYWSIPILSGKKEILGVITLYLREKAHPDKSQEEFIKAFANVLAGIIERRRAREELEKSRAFIKRTLEMAQGIIMVLDKEANIIDVNEYIEKLTGFKKKYFLGKNWISLFMPQEKESLEIHELFKKCFVDRELGCHETEFLTKDRNKLTISWYISGVRDEKGSLLVTIVVGVDITQRKEAEKLQRLAQLGRLVGDMAHEVNNPLMVVSGRAQLSLMEENVPGEVKRNLEIIMKECQRAKEIIQRLLTFSRPSRGEIKKIDINKTIEEVLQLIEHQFILANIQIEREYSQDLPLISADEKQLQEVFMNFLNNSKEAMPKGGLIKVTTQREGKFLRIEFKDTGIGMTSEELEKATEPFFTTKEKGTGLGLSVCEGIIRAYKGRLFFKSKKGEGTTAIVLLPLEEGGEGG